MSRYPSAGAVSFEAHDHVAAVLEFEIESDLGQSRASSGEGALDGTSTVQRSGASSTAAAPVSPSGLYKADLGKMARGPKGRSLWFHAFENRSRVFGRQGF